MIVIVAIQYRGPFEGLRRFKVQKFNVVLGRVQNVQAVQPRCSVQSFAGITTRRELPRVGILENNETFENMLNRRNAYSKSQPGEAYASEYAGRTDKLTLETVRREENDENC